MSRLGHTAAWVAGGGQRGPGRAPHPPRQLWRRGHTGADPDGGGWGRLCRGGGRPPPGPPFPTQLAGLHQTARKPPPTRGCPSTLTPFLSHPRPGGSAFSIHPSAGRPRPAFAAVLPQRTTSRTHRGSLPSALASPPLCRPFSLRSQRRRLRTRAGPRPSAPARGPHRTDRAKALATASRPLHLCLGPLLRLPSHTDASLFLTRASQASGVCTVRSSGWNAVPATWLTHPSCVFAQKSPQ